MKIPRTHLEWRTLCFSSYKNGKSKIKLCWVELGKEKKRVHFSKVYFVLRRGLFVAFVFIQCTKCWINLQNIYTFYLLPIKKHYFKCFFCLFLKSLKVIGVSLTFRIPWNAVASLEKFDVAWHQNDRRFLF